jgi:hypothetical protein
MALAEARQKIAAGLADAMGPTRFLNVPKRERLNTMLAALGAWASGMAATVDQMREDLIADRRRKRSDPSGLVSASGASRPAPGVPGPVIP